MKICTVVGARPQFVKAAVISRNISKYNEMPTGDHTINEVIIHTGQHYDFKMSQVFFDELQIPKPHYNLAVGSGSHGKMTGKMLEKIEEVLMLEKPDVVLVHGDTNSTIAGALAATKIHLPVAHVESGLRSFDRRMPEEINRILTDHASDILYCPSENSVRNLRHEGVTKGVMKVGDVMFDAVLFYQKNAIPPAHPGPFVLASLHRADNTENVHRLKSIIDAFNEFPVPIILPLHPRTRMVLENEKIRLNENIVLQEPFSYFTMLGYLKACEFVVTDSGGLQKEAYFLEKKCVTVRDQTEWVELVECDANRIVGSRTETILNAVQWAIEPLASTSRIYGEGDAGRKIVTHLRDLIS